MRAKMSDEDDFQRMNEKVQGALEAAIGLFSDAPSKADIEAGWKTESWQAMRRRLDGYGKINAKIVQKRVALGSFLTARFKDDAGIDVTQKTPATDALHRLAQAWNSRDDKLTYKYHFSKGQEGG